MTGRSAARAGITDVRSARGTAGERTAAQFLARHGFRVVQRNFTCPRGEIDIVAEDRGTLVFVEVKARDVHGNELPEAAVTRSKRRRLCLAAREFIRRYRLGGRTFRFDVVGVDLEGDEPVRVHHWPNVVEYRNAVRRRRS